jgi:hypothetical protein
MEIALSNHDFGVSSAKEMYSSIQNCVL